MNIAIFTDTYFPCINGVASSVYTLSKELNRRGHQVYVFTVSEPRCRDKEHKSKAFAIRRVEQGVVIFRLPSIPVTFLKPNRIASPISLRVHNIIKRLKIDVIHTQTEFAMGFMGKSISKTFGIPLLHTYHTMYEDYTHYVAKGLILTPDMARAYSRTFCNMAATVIVPTEKTAQSLEQYGVKRPIFVIPTGIDLAPFMKEQFSPSDIAKLKGELGLDPAWPIILCLGRIAKEKSLDVVLEQMPKILTLVPEARLVIVGDGPERSNLQLLAKKLQIEKRVIFTGGVPYKQIGLYYQLGDAFVCCSQTETQGLTYYEAMAAGIPIAARQDECIKSVIIDRVSGRLFEDNDDLPKLLAEMLLNKEQSQSYASNAYGSIVPYAATTFAERIEDIYAHTVDSARVQKAYKVNARLKPLTPEDIKRGALRYLNLTTPTLSQRPQKPTKQRSSNRKDLK